MIDFEKYRNSKNEQLRIQGILNLIPQGREKILEIGARDCYISKKLTYHCNQVYALDLEKPEIQYPKITPVKGDITNLNLENNSFDLVICAEVLEHISPPQLQNASNELIRVSSKYILVGVPFKQDIRLGQTKCINCGKINPPYGHLNSFTIKKLKKLFSNAKILDIKYIGEHKSKTNWISVFLNYLANNPGGTYLQEESCVFCNNKLSKPKINWLKLSLFKMALLIQKIQLLFYKRHAIWVHILFDKYK